MGWDQLKIGIIELKKISIEKIVQPVIRSLSGSRFSRHQFAFLLCLIESFPEKLKPTIIYDPEFNNDDEKIIGKVEILQKNFM